MKMVIESGSLMYKVCAVVFNERSGHAGLTFSLALILYMSQAVLVYSKIHNYLYTTVGSVS